LIGTLADFFARLQELGVCLQIPVLVPFREPSSTVPHERAAAEQASETRCKNRCRLSRIIDLLPILQIAARRHYSERRRRTEILWSTDRRLHQLIWDRTDPCAVTTDAFICRAVQP
jgi:hypothetical protein